MNISKSNPLNFMYHKWLQLGGDPKDQEDLCHFMRVCMFFWWARWLCSPEFYNETPADENHLNGKFRLPRIAIFIGEFCAIAFITHLLNKGILLSVSLLILVGIAVISMLIVFSVGVRVVSGKINSYEAVGTFKSYLSARKQRMCPFITVEK